jgi:hypothetical protein
MLAQTKGLAAVFAAATQYCRIARTSASVLRYTLRASSRRCRLPNQHSTRSTHYAEMGVQCTW